MIKPISPERKTQNRVIDLFRDDLGYRYLGDWTDRNNSNIEDDLLSAYLISAGYTTVHVSRALHQLRTEANNPNRSLYDNNKSVYSLLRYGVPVKTEAGGLTDTIWLVDWKNPEKNHFAIAEEVTLLGNQERRPDLVLYLNGLAMGMIELKTVIPPSVMVYASYCPISKRSLTSGFFRPCKLYLPVMIPRACDTGRSRRKKSIFCNGKKTRPMTVSSSWINIC